MRTHDLIVLGGGAAGLSVASGCAQLGLKTAVVEREHMGGDCLHYGCVPSKTLIHLASRFAAARGVDRFVRGGLSVPPAEMPPINKQVAGVVAAIAHHDSPERFRALGADVYLGVAAFRSAHEIEADGELLSADRIVVATGSRAALPPIPGLSESGFLTNRDVFSLPELPASLLVIGGGPIGVELGQAFRRLGSEVTIVEMASRILPRDDEELAAVVADRLRREGVRVIVGAAVEQVANTPHGRTVTVRKQQEAETILAEQLLVASGRQGNADGLALARAGLEPDRSGFIPVDDKLQSAVRHISVIGDANGRWLFTHVAGAEAALAVRRLALRAGGRINYRNVPWVSYTDPELAAVGHSEASATAAGIRARAVRQRFDGVDRAHAEEATEGLLKVVLDRRDRVIGVQIAARGAGELLAPALHAVKRGWKLSRFREAMIPYPTMSEAFGKAASSELAPKLFNPTVRKMLKGLFRYRGGGPVAAEAREAN